MHPLVAELKKIIADNNISIAILAEKSGYSKSNIYSTLRDGATNINAIGNIAQVLGLRLTLTKVSEVPTGMEAKFVPKGRSSGYRGGKCYYKHRIGWAVRLTVKGQRIDGGYFREESDAAAAAAALIKKFYHENN